MIGSSILRDSLLHPTFPQANTKDVVRKISFLSMGIGEIDSLVKYNLTSSHLQRDGSDRKYYRQYRFAGSS